MYKTVFIVLSIENWFVYILYLPHGVQLFHGSCKGLLDQVVVSHNDGNTGMGVQVVGLGLGVESLDIIEDGSKVFLHGGQSVLEVLSVELLLGTLVVGFAGRVELSLGVGILFQELVEENIPNLGGNVSGLGLDEQLSEFKAKSLNFLFQMHGLAENGRTIIGQEAVFGKEWSRVGWISVGNSQRRSGRNVVHGGSDAVSFIVVGDNNIWIGVVVEHIGHGSDLLHSLWLPYFLESSESHVVGPLDDLFVLDSTGLKRKVSLVKGLVEPLEGSLFVTGEPSSVWGKAAEAVVWMKKE